MGQYTTTDILLNEKWHLAYFPLCLFPLVYYSKTMECARLHTEVLSTSMLEESAFIKKINK